MISTFFSIQNTTKNNTVNICRSVIDRLLRYLFFDALYITSKEKYKLDINYTNGIFIDDNPSDLSGLYSKNPIKVIRLRRENNKHSLENLKNENIKEYSNFLEVPID